MPKKQIYIAALLPLLLLAGEALGQVGYGSISGSIKATWEPYIPSNARIEVVDTAVSTHSDSSGHFILNLIPVGVHELKVVAKDTLGNSSLIRYFGIIVGSGEQIELDLLWDHGEWNTGEGVECTYMRRLLSTEPRQVKRIFAGNLSTGRNQDGWCTIYNAHW